MEFLIVVNMCIRLFYNYHLGRWDGRHQRRFSTAEKRSTVVISCLISPSEHWARNRCWTRAGMTSWELQRVMTGFSSVWRNDGNDGIQQRLLSGNFRHVEPLSGEYGPYAERELNSRLIPRDSGLRFNTRGTLRR